MLMSAELFLNCLILVIHDTRTETINMIKELIAIYEEDNKTLGVTGDEMCLLYIRIIQQIFIYKVDFSNAGQKADFILKIRSEQLLKDKDDIKETILSIINDRENVDSDYLLDKLNYISNTLVWYRQTKAVRSMFFHSQTVRDVIQPTEQKMHLDKIKQLAQDILDIKTSVTGELITAKASNRVDFSDKTSMMSALDKVSKRNKHGVFRYGLQGLNRMSGSIGGAALGESICFNARSHNGKSLLLCYCAWWFTAYNIPIAIDKPSIVLFISVENEAFQNYITIAKKAYYEITGDVLPKTMSNEDICEFIHTEFAKFKYKLEILRFVPSEFGFDELVEVVRHYESLGYVVSAIILDYLSKMKGGSDTRSSTGANHLMVRELFSSCANYTKNNDITFVTAHQLNRKADELVLRGGKIDVVKYYGPDFMSDSSDVQREIDMSIYLEIEKNHEKVPFMTVGWGKHRYVDDTPMAHKYFAQILLPGIGLADDINKTPGYTTNIRTYSFDNANAGATVEAMRQEAISQLEEAF